MTHRLMALGAAGAIALAASGGATHAAPDFRLSYSPFRIETTGRTLSRSIILRNEGTHSISISASFRAVSPGAGHACVLTPSQSWARVTPASVTIPPGGKRRERISVHAPGSAPVDLAAVFSAATPRARAGTGLAVVGAVATRVELGTGSHSVALCGKPPIAARPVSHGGLPLYIWWVDCIVGVLLAALAWRGWALARRVRYHRNGRAAVVPQPAREKPTEHGAALWHAPRPGGQHRFPAEAEELAGPDDYTQIREGFWKQ
jgi:hypothetical protein